MTLERRKEAEKIFQAALDHSTAERAGFLEKVCAADPELRKEVESLLASHQESSHEQDPALIDDLSSDPTMDRHEIGVTYRAKGGEQKVQPARDVIGSTISHYRVLEKLGEGGMGVVYLAEDTKLKRKVGLKILPEDLTRDQDRKRRFITEARAAAAIEHPHIAAIYDIDEVEGQTFIAMEYVRGGSLRDSIRAEKLTLAKTLEIAAQIAEALAKVHERGVVHRDVKPENVLMSEEGYPKIIDFGLAKLLEPLSTSGEEDEESFKTQQGMVMGTLAYMSPEQAKGEAVDARSDIFSFGAMLYEMLSGDEPFKRQSAIATLSAILQEALPRSS